MIVTNKTRHAVVYGKTVLLPGSNVVDDFDASKYPLLADMKKSGTLEVVESFHGDILYLRLYLCRTDSYSTHSNHIEVVSYALIAKCFVRTDSFT